MPFLHKQAGNVYALIAGKMSMSYLVLLATAIVAIAMTADNAEAAVTTVTLPVGFPNINNDQGVLKSCISYMDPWQEGGEETDTPAAVPQIFQVIRAPASSCTRLRKLKSSRLGLTSNYLMICSPFLQSRFGTLVPGV
jgi:hypothetical protein